jgi:hypothetical protein
MPRIKGVRYKQKDILVRVSRYRRVLAPAFGFGTKTTSVLTNARAFSLYCAFAKERGFRASTTVVKATVLQDFAFSLFEANYRSVPSILSIVVSILRSRYLIDGTDSFEPERVRKVQLDVKRWASGQRPNKAPLIHKIVDVPNSALTWRLYILANFLLQLGLRSCSFLSLQPHHIISRGRGGDSTSICVEVPEDKVQKQAGRRIFLWCNCGKSIGSSLCFIHGPNIPALPISSEDLDLVTTFYKCTSHSFRRTAIVFTIAWFEAKDSAIREDSVRYRYLCSHFGWSHKSGTLTEYIKDAASPSGFASLLPNLQLVRQVLGLQNEAGPSARCITIPAPKKLIIKGLSQQEQPTAASIEEEWKDLISDVENEVEYAPSLPRPKKVLVFREPVKTVPKAAPEPLRFSKAAKPMTTSKPVPKLVFRSS